MITQTELKRQIGIRTATALVVGEVIAVGIFLTPAGMAKSLGSPLWVLVVWLVMGAMAVCGALCYGELAARYPQAGGSYVYLREAYGRPVAFLYGWMALLVMDPGLTAALAVGMAGYAGYIFNLSPIGMKAVAIAAIVLLAAINIRGVRLGAWLMRWLTVLKLGLLSFLLLWGFGFQLGNWSNFTPFVAQRAQSTPLLPALAGGLVAAFFSFGGWWDVTKLAGEVRDPARTLPRALLYGVVIVTLVYILTSAVFFYLVPLEAVTSGETFAAQAGEVLFGRAARAGVLSDCNRGGRGQPGRAHHVGAACLFRDGSRWIIHSRSSFSPSAIRHSCPRYRIAGTPCFYPCGAWVALTKSSLTSSSWS